MTVQINDILRVAARLNIQGQGDFVNVYHFRWEGAAAAADADAVTYCAARLDKAYTAINTKISDDCLYTDVNVFNVTQDRPLGSTVWPALTGGGASDEVMPSQSALFVRFLSGYSRNWAKKFIGPVTIASNTAAGLVEGAAMTQLAAYAAELLTPTVGTLADDLVYVVRRTADSQWYPVVEAVIRNVWSTIRTRRAGRGS